MTDEDKVRKLDDMKDYLRMDEYIPQAVINAEKQTTFGSKKNYTHSIDSSREFKQKMKSCVTYHNQIEENKSISGSFISKFVKIEEKLKQAHHGDIQNNAEELRNRMSELAESWRRSFGLKKSRPTSLHGKYEGYPYNPKVIYSAMTLLAEKGGNPEFPYRIGLRIVQDAEEIINSEDTARTEVEANFDIADGSDIDKEDSVSESKFLGALENLRRAKQEASYESLQGSGFGGPRDDLENLVSKYLIEEKGFDKSEISSNLSINTFRNVFCKQTRDPKTFRESVDEIMIGMQRVNMISADLNSIGQVSSRNIVSNGEYGENLARVLGRLCNYAEEAYDEAEVLIDENDSDQSSSGW